MADPLSITASIIAVLQASTAVIGYLKNVNGGARDKLRILDEVRNSIVLLEMLRDRAEDAELKGTWESAIVSLNSPGGPLTQFRVTMDMLADKLGPAGGIEKATRILKWPFDKADVIAMLNSLERQKSLFNLAIQLDHVKLSQAIQADIQTANDGISRLRLGQQSQEQRMKDADREKLVAWLSPTDFHIKHADVLSQWQEGTGQWLLASSQFQGWLKGTGRTLWCPGIPGAGKTVLVSAIINYLETISRDPDFGIAFIYFDYKKQNEQNVEDLLLAIVRQLVQPQDDIPFEVQQMYDDHKRRRTRPHLVECSKILSLVVSKFSKIFLIIDALDECKDLDSTRTKLVSEIQKLPASAHTLVTSRFTSDIENSFSHVTQVEIRATDEDVTTYLKSRMAQESRLRKHVQTEPSLADEIVEAILERVQGMFLLAQLHTDSLARKQNRKALRLALKSLPQSLDDTYAEAMQRISRQDADDVELAKKVLSWICFAKRPLYVKEIQQAIAAQELEDQEFELGADGIPDEEFLTAVCVGLVAIDRESGNIRLVHYTTQDYFQRFRETLFPNSNLILASTCIKYLSLGSFSSGVCTSDRDLQERFWQFPFFQYAAQHWGDHARETLDASKTELVVSFLKNDTAVSAAIQAKWVPDHRYSGWSEHYPRGVPTLVYAATFGLSLSALHLLDASVDINESGSDDQTALIAASRNGHVDIVSELLCRGADVNAKDLGGETALAAAASQGYSPIVDQLIAAKSNIDSQASDGWTSLMAAASNGHQQIVEKLIAAGADVRLQSVAGASAITISIQEGYKGIIRALLTLENKFLIQTSEGRTALALARRIGNQEIIQELEAHIAGLSTQVQLSRPTLIRDDNRNLHLDGNGQAVARFIPRSSIRPVSTPNRNYSNTFKTHYVLGELLGNGHFAEVFACRHRASGLRYCVKVFTGKGENPAIGHDGGEFEIRLLAKLKHPNIISIKDSFIGDNKVYIVTELAPVGDLFNFIVMKQKLSEAEARKIFIQIFDAIKYLHDLKIIHRDIKPENAVLMDEESLQIKLTDFGISKELKDEYPDSQGNICATTLCGTPSYVAPEILCNTSHRAYGLSVDIWSAGVVLYICLCGFPPFSEDLYSENYPYSLTQQIKEGRFDYMSPYWDSVGDPALYLIDSMLTVDVGKRYTVEDCLNHPWLKGEVPLSDSDRIKGDPLDFVSGV